MSDMRDTGRMTRTLPPMVTVSCCSTRITLDREFQEWTFAPTLVTVDQAHELIEKPYVVVNADRFGSPSLFRNTRDVFETGWSVYALALIEDEAMAAADQAAEALREDIATGNIAKGAHSHWVPRNPLEAPVEAELRAYREQVLRELERTA